MSVFHNNALIGASGQGGYQIERSLRFNSADSAYLNRTFVTPTNAFIFTISAWVKRAASSVNIENIFGVGTGAAAATSWLGFFNDILYLAFQDGSYSVASSAVYRDPGAWYHVVAAVDTTQATASNRVKLYVNGLQLTAVTASYPPQNSSWQMNGAYYHVVGARYRTTIDSYFNGYITEFNFVDGQALTPSSFGETNAATGVWQPKKYTGTYGTNGFYLKFADNSGTTSTTLGKDSSGNGNNWTPNNFSVTAGAGNDSMIDTPTPYADGGNGRGNYCTLNPLAFGNTNYTSTISDGNLQIYATTYGGANSRTYGTTFSSQSGKWYYEVDVITVSGSGNNLLFGWTSTDISASLSTFSGSRSLIGVICGYTANTSTSKYSNTTSSTAITGASTQGGDRVMIAIDFGVGKAWIGKNGSWWNASNTLTTFDETSPTITFTPTGLLFYPFVEPVGSSDNSNRSGAICNFGQRPFAYTPPSGFLALNTQNLPEPTIKKPNQYFDATLYTGNGTNITVTNSGGFTPDMVWHKGRSVAYSHSIVDAVRGNSNVLSTDTTGAEANPGAQLDITTGGFISTYRSANLANNQNSATYVGWQWKESATPGFDIVTFTAQATATTVAHSLGVAPKFIIIKSRDNAAALWLIYHADVGTQKYLQFSTAASTTNSTVFSTAPTSTVFDPGTGLTTGNGYNAMVAYLWSEVAGFSKFGSYTGNGSSDGPFVYCGFKPRWLMIKRSDSVESWLMFDTARESYNPTDDALWANLSNAESANYTPQDFLSNGFKIRTSSTSTNASGGTYIFAAFAETPFKSSLAR